MRQYQVPQFITVEDKAIGGIFTIKEAVYVIAAVLLGALAYQYFEGVFLYAIWIVLGILATALIRYKPQGRSFGLFLWNLFFYLIKPRLYLWRQEEPRAQKRAPEKQKQEAYVRSIPKLSESKLSDLAWSLDIKEKLKEEEEKQR